MKIRKGSRVRYKAGSGQAVGTVVQVKGDRVVIQTARRGQVTRLLDNLSDPDEEEPADAGEESPLFDTVASTDTEQRADWEDTFRPRDVVKLPPENGHAFSYEASEDDEDVDEGDDDFVEPDEDGDEDDYGDDDFFDSDLEDENDE